MVENLENNVFIRETLNGLIKNNVDVARLGTRGFEFDNIKSEKDCVLVMGLNLAGDEKAAKNEKNKRTFLYSFSNMYIKGSPYVYNPYYRPIYNLMNEVFDGDVKWHWCNKNWDDLENEIENSNDRAFINEIREEYYNHKNKKVSIYIGDMFYYHETNSKKLPISKDIDLKSYYFKMLKLHINELKKEEKNIKFIYINNAEVSTSMCGNSLKTVEEYNNKDDNSKIPIFYGGMLSSPMDSFSKKRLVNEIKNYLNKEK